MIDGTERFTTIALPHIGHKVFQVGDAVALLVTLVVQSATTINAIGGHSMTPKATIAAVALIYQWIAACGALNHGIEPGHIPFAALICPLTVIVQGPLHGVSKGIVGTCYIYILTIHKIIGISLFLVGGYNAYVRNASVNLLTL